MRLFVSYYERSVRFARLSRAICFDLASVFDTNGARVDSAMEDNWEGPALKERRLVAGV